MSEYEYDPGEYAEDDSIPGANESGEAWQEVDQSEVIEALAPMLRAEMQAEFARYDEQNQARAEQYAPPSPLTIEEASALHWEQQRQILEHNIGKELTEVEVAGLNHILDRNPQTGIGDAYQQFKDMPVGDKHRIAYAALQDDMRDAQFDQRVQAGEVVDKSEWSSDPDTRREQRAAYALARVQGRI